MDFTEQQRADFNRYYDDACKAQEGIIILGNYRPKGVGFFEKLRAKKAIRLFEKALMIHPESSQCLFFVGKIYQRLEEYQKALSYIEAAMVYEKGNENLPMEASLVAMQLDLVDKAIELSAEAVKRKPDASYVLGNHSMNLLITGHDQDAKDTINKALLSDPNDEINKRIKQRIDDVIAGVKKRPTFKESLG